MTSLDRSVNAGWGDVIPDRAVTVGYDGSFEAERAVRWAALDALTRGQSLRIVMAYRLAPLNAVAPVAGGVDQFRFLDLPAASEQAVAGIVGRLRRDLPGLAIDSRVVEGHAIKVLLEASGSASTLVVGSRGRGPVAGALCGSLSASVSARATCPVVVVRPPLDATRPPRRQLVVGVDGSDLTAATLRFAFDYAERHALTVRAILCWEPNTLPTPARNDPRVIADEQARAEGTMAEALAGWQQTHPRVPVERVVLAGDPVRTLARESCAAQLLVVGAHHRHGRIGALLGSVSQGVVYHAHAPVAVITTRSEPSRDVRIAFPSPIGPQSPR